jgi:hypothetical protein
MEQWFLLGLIVAIVVVMVALARIIVRPRARAGASAAVDSPIGVSTEGMKVCPKCGMGNLWTESRCISCASALRG